MHETYLEVMNTGAMVSNALLCMKGYTAHGSLQPAMRSTQPSISSRQANVMTTEKGVVVFRCVDRAATAPLMTRQIEETAVKMAAAVTVGRNPYGLSDTSHVASVQGEELMMKVIHESCLVNLLLPATK